MGTSHHPFNWKTKYAYYLQQVAQMNSLECMHAPCMFCLLLYHSMHAIGLIVMAGLSEAFLCSLEIHNTFSIQCVPLFLYVLLLVHVHPGLAEPATFSLYMHMNS